MDLGEEGRAFAFGDSRMRSPAAVEGAPSDSPDIELRPDGEIGRSDAGYVGRSKGESASDGDRLREGGVEYEYEERFEETPWDLEGVPRSDAPSALASRCNEVFHFGLAIPEPVTAGDDTERGLVGGLINILLILLLEGPDLRSLMVASPCPV